MKQGKADSSGPGAQKVEPICHDVSVGAVSQIGAHTGVAPPPLEGPRAPHPATAGTTIHRSGGQGRH